MGLRLGANVNSNKHELETALRFSTYFGVGEVVRADLRGFLIGIGVVRILNSLVRKGKRRNLAATCRSIIVCI